MIAIIDWINEAVGRVVSLFAGLFAVIIIYDVFMRYVMNAPTPWGLPTSPGRAAPPRPSTSSSR